MDDKPVPIEEDFDVYFERDTVNTDAQENDSNNNKTFGPDFASVPDKIKEMSETVNAIKATVDMIQAKSFPHITPVSNIQSKDDRIDSLVLCKSLEDIIKNFTELSYDVEEQLVKCDLCDRQPRLGGNVPGLFKYEPDFDPEKDVQSKTFRNLKAHLKAHFENKTHVDNWEMMKKSEDEDRQFENRCHEVGLRIARLCNDGYKSGASKRSFKN